MDNDIRPNHQPASNPPKAGDGSPSTFAHTGQNIVAPATQPNGPATNTGWATTTAQPAVGTPFAATTSTGSISSSDPGGATPRKKSPLKWILIIGIPLLLIICLLVWYFAIFNNKYNVVRSALYNAMSNRDNSIDYKIAIQSSSDDSDLRVDLDGSANYLARGDVSGDMSLSMTNSGSSADIGKLSFAGDGDNIYLKIALSDLLAGQGLDLSSYGLDDQWIRISADDLSSATSATDSDGNSVDPDKVMQCMQEGANELDNRASQQQIVDALLDTDFLVIGDAASDEDGRFYQISLDSTHYRDFAERLRSSNYMSAMTNCFNDNNIAIDDELDDSEIEYAEEQIDQMNPEVRLWVSGLFDRQIAKISASVDSDDTNISATITFANQAPTVDMPSDSQTFEEIVQNNPALLQLFSSSLTTLNTTTVDNPGNNNSSNVFDIDSTASIQY